MKKLLLTALLLGMCAQAQSVEVAGVKLTDSIHFGNHDLVLNGAGVRTKFFLKVYVAALYLVEKQTTANAIITDENSQRVALHMLRDLSDEKLLHAFNEAIEANHTKLEMTQLDFSIKHMTEIFHQVKEVKTGDVIALDYLPGSGTQISLNGVARGTISGDMFHRALLKIWLGAEPVQADLKLKLLGGN